MSDRDETPELVAASPLPPGDPAGGLDHLAENRRLVVRRALLAATVGGVIPSTATLMKRNDQPQMNASRRRRRIGSVNHEDRAFPA